MEGVWLLLGCIFPAVGVIKTFPVHWFLVGFWSKTARVVQET